MADDLGSWRDTATRRAVLEFVAEVSDVDGPGYVPPSGRVAVFDNDGTLWCESPAQVQMDFILRRLAAMAGDDPALRTQQPWQAAFGNDLAWFGEALTRHYDGDDSMVAPFLGGVLSAFGAMSVDDFARQAADFLQQARHPSLGIGYLETAYAPMVELLGYLEANSFTNYIVSGGGRDFLRPVSEALYGIPPERVIGSAVKLSVKTGDREVTVLREPALDVIDDGPAKVVGIWEHIGRVPVFAAGNSNGDIPMLQYTASDPRRGFGMLINHDDAGREFAYTAGAEQALDSARDNGWTVVSMRNDWSRVLAATRA